MKTVIHRLFQEDLRSALRYYDEEGSTELGDRFFSEVENTIRRIERGPKHFHFVSDKLRRAQLDSFPYHILFEESAYLIGILVLRHDKRHPSSGLRRQPPND